MTLVYLDADEWYPVYTIEREAASYREGIDLPDEVIERIEQVTLEFTAVQNLLREAQEAAKKGSK